MALMTGSLAAQQPLPDTPVPGQRDLQNQRQAQTPGLQGGHASTQTSTFLTDAAKSGVKEVKIGKMALEKAQNPAVKQFAQTVVNDHSRVNQQLLQLATRKGVTLPTDVQECIAEQKSGVAATDRYQPSAKPGLQDRQPVREGVKNDQPDQDRQQARDTLKDAQPADPNRLTRDQPRQTQPGEAEHGDKQHDASMEKMKGLTGTEFDRAFIEHMTKSHEMGVQKYEQALRTVDDAEVKAFAATTLPTLRQHLQQVRSLATSTGAGIPSIQNNPGTQNIPDK